MNKILLFAGIMFFCVLVLYVWFFIGNIGDFAKFLGEESKEIVGDESKFVGHWVDEKMNMQWYNFSSDGTVSLMDLAHGNYEIKDDHLANDIISKVNPSSIIDTITFDYYFSENYTKLHLKSINQTGWDIYVKQ